MIAGMTDSPENNEQPPTNPRHPTHAMPEVLLSKSAPRPNLDVLLAFWQPILGLSDWVIRAEYDATITNLGQTTVWWRDREAHMRICEPATITRQWPPVDSELTFVHELVHCVIEPLTHAADTQPVPMPPDLREQQVEQLAKALVRLHRVYPLAHDWLWRAP